MKKEFSNNTLEVFTKVLFHNIPNILTYIDEIPDRRQGPDYSMRYVTMSEMLMFLSEGRSQRFTETAFKEEMFYKNMEKIIQEKVTKVPDSEIYTNTFSRIEQEEIDEFQYKIMYQMLRSKKFQESKILGRYNTVIDGVTFQKSHRKISDEWLSKTINGETTYNISMLDMKLVVNDMAISLKNEMIRNKDMKNENETEEDVAKKSEEKRKQDCELNASKRLIKNFKEMYPRLKIRIIADSLYPSAPLIALCEESDIEYIFVLKDKKLPTLLNDFLEIVSMPEGKRAMEENANEIIFTMWENEIDYRGKKVNVIRQIRKNKKTNEDSVWMWITNRKITEKNLRKIVYCAKLRDYIENQGFREQKVTSGIDLEHVYSENTKAIKVIYVLIQITHMLLQIIEHSDICGDFKEKYRSVKVFRRKFYAHLIERIINIEQIQIKIQIRFNKSLMIC